VLGVHHGFVHAGAVVSAAAVVVTGAGAAASDSDDCGGEEFNVLEDDTR